MEPFSLRHRALILKHARAYVRANPEKTAVEDVAREIELVVDALAAKSEATAALLDGLASPDAFLRANVRHAAGRAKRRQTLVEQVAAGDDLEAVRHDLAQLDADLPEPPARAERDEEANAARAKLDAVRDTLSPADRLVFAMWIEDAETDGCIAETISHSLEDLAEAKTRVLAAAAAQQIPADADSRENPSTSPDERREKRLRAMAELAGASSAAGGHVEEPVLALVRSGDHDDDLADALAHVADCADCRARLTEGETSRRSLVVMAIEAPRASLPDIATVVEMSGARLLERGAGRWTAVVDADKASALKDKLESGSAEGSSSKVTRIAVAEPVDVPLDGGDAARSHGGRVSRASYPELHSALPAPTGTAAAEVAAWAEVARAPRRPVPTPSAGWTTFAVGAVALAVAIGYFLATR